MSYDPYSLPTSFVWDVHELIDLDIYSNRALLINIRAYNEAHAAGEKEKTAGLEKAMAASLPLLDRVGMFDLFTPDEWIQGTNEGRKTVGRLYQEFKSRQNA